MRKLVLSMNMDEIIEMLREIRELSEMSPSEREIYALYYPDAQIIAECDRIINFFERRCAKGFELTEFVRIFTESGCGHLKTKK